MKICIACGMPMRAASEFAGEDTSKAYCIHCARPDGSMQSFEEKKLSMINFMIKTQGIDEKAAAKVVENNMKKLPAWQDHSNMGYGDV